MKIADKWTFEEDGLGCSTVTSIHCDKTLGFSSVICMSDWSDSDDPVVFVYDITHNFLNTGGN